MTKTSLDPRNFFLGNFDYQKNYVKNSYYWYRDLFGHTSYDYAALKIRRLELVHKNYERGVRKGWLSCTYAQYERAVVKEGGNLRWYEHHVVRDYPTRIPYSVRKALSFGKYRVGKKYVRDVEHLPKDKDPRQLWREHKRFKKDKTPRHWFSGSKTRRCFKKLGNSQRRARDKGLIKAEKWDSFGRLALPADPWAWD